MRGFWISGVLLTLNPKPLCVSCLVGFRGYGKLRPPRPPNPNIPETLNSRGLEFEVAG